MAYPNLQKPYKLYTDACDYAVGGILVQEDDDNVERVIQYVSHQLNGSQLKWATIEKEAYAVVYCLTKLRPYLYGSEFTVFTDYQPLKSLFTAEMKNTKIQRWAVLIAEYGCDIQYHQGARNIRADMLSRIKPINEVATFDTAEYIDPDAFPDDNADMRLPLEADSIDREELMKEQQLNYVDLFEEANDDDSEYRIFGGLLYSIKPVSPLAPEYPRLILPEKFHKQVIERCHKATGHQAAQKTLSRVRDSYVWPGMRKHVADVVLKCPVCRVHVNRAVHTRFGDMPLPSTPMQIIGMDLIGPFTESNNGNKYVLTIIDHCSGWAEALPIPTKSAIHIKSQLLNEFIPRHGVPEVIITDCGLEFNAAEVKQVYRDMGIEHRRTTPYHPQTNGKTERFNRTLKEMLSRLINNDHHNWESQLAAALTAYRHSTSVVTGYTPFYLLYGRRGRLPLVKSFQVATGPAHNARLYELAKALTNAKEMTARSRQYNRERINQRATAGNVQIGDTVVVKANERLTFTSKWDPQYEVYDTRGPVVWIRNQNNGKTKVVNKDKVRVVDPDIIWDEVRPRPRRSQQQVPTVSQDVPLPVNDVISDTEQEFEVFEEETKNQPPGFCTRAAFKRFATDVNSEIESKRGRWQRDKQRSEDHATQAQKRQRIEAVELAALFYSFS